MNGGALDPLVFGQRLRHLRRRRQLTLGELGRRIGRQASYLSQLENGHREPRLSMVNELARALSCSTADLLDSEPPNRRAELEVTLARIQDEPAYRQLALPYLRPSARLDDAALEHVVSLYERLRQLQALASPGTGSGGARAANRAMRDEMRARDNYFQEIEEAAAPALAAVGYPGTGAVSERLLTELASYFGFAIVRSIDLPPSTRSITDLRRRVIHVPQRNTTGGARSARSVIAQTLGHFALGHEEPADFDSYVRQRVEANYFAGALLAPESAVVELLGEAKSAGDISVEDVNELFYVSYEMAAHRITNLITRHFAIPVHFLRTDPSGRLWKGYENDGVPFPAAPDGTIEGAQVCRRWGARQAFESEDAYAIHYQYTDTPAGSFWCATHIEVLRDLGDEITIGTNERYARYFRGSGTTRRAVSRCPEPSCCRQPAAEQERRWEGVAWASARDQSHFVSGLPTDTVSFSTLPGVDLTDVYSFLDRHDES